MAPQQSSSTMPSSDDIILPIEKGFSDGDKSVWPQDPRYNEADPGTYQKKLAMQWIQSSGAQEIGKSYTLDQLPEGYCVFEKPRHNQPTTKDKYLFGHPSGGIYTSPNKFWPHFQYLMNGGETPCTCELCTSKGKKPTGSSRGAMASSAAGPSGASKGRGRQKDLENIVVDEEGTTDVFKLLAMKLKDQLTLDEPVTEPNSIDWRAEHPGILHYLKNISRQHSFIPRSGELVLFFFDREGDLVFDEEAGKFGFYDEKQDKIVDYPVWRAGTVGELPEETVLLDDILIDTPKLSAVNYSGFRVETFPDPNGYDKGYSSQYKYVPMSHIRPLNYWQIFLQGIPQESFHPSIENALTVMSSLSVVDKYHFLGKWPNARIFCRGIFYGAELFTIGDSVRIMPNRETITSTTEVTEVLSIKSIYIRLISCDAEMDSEQLSEEMVARVYGKAYTLLPENAYRPPGSTEDPVPMTEEEVINAFENVGMSGYGTWYRMHPDKGGVEISMDRIVGRCYEPDAMQLLFETKSLGLDLEGALAAREFSSLNDERIPEDKFWFWGDCRTETLALESLNGQEVGKFEDIRNPRMWRANLKILDGKATKADIKAAMPSRGVGRPARDPSGVSADLSGFAEVGKTSSLVTAALGATTTSAAVSSGDGEDGGVAAAASMSAENSGGQEGFPGALGGGEGARKTKEGGAFGDDEGENESEDSEGEVEAEPAVLLRGGTEESEGGDYNPDKERLAKRRRQA